MIYSSPVASPAPLYSAGAEPQRGSLGLAARAGASTECWGLPSVRQRRVGRLLGLSVSSPLAERVSGRTASVGPILPTALKQRLRLPGPTAKNALLSPSSQADLEGLSGRQGGPLGSAARLPGPCCCIASFLASSAGPPRDQVVDMRWLRAWATSRLHRTAGRAERGLC